MELILRMSKLYESLEEAREHREATLVLRGDVRHPHPGRAQRIASACGYGVPVYEFKHERQQLARWAARKGPDGIASYQAQKNRASIDGLPGLISSPEAELGEGSVG